MTEQEGTAVSKEDLAEAYFSARAAHYAQSPAHADPESLAWFRDFAGLGAGAAGIDVACGAGHSAVALAPGTGMVLALDLSLAMLQETRRMAQKQGEGQVQVAAADSHHLPLGDGVLDFVSCRRAAHHFSDLRRALQEFHRVMKVGGTLIIDDRTVPDDPIADVLQQELDTLHDPSHVRQYTLREWKDYLEESGYELMQCHEYHRDRPLEAFIEGAPAGNEARIRDRVAGLNEIERDKLNVQCHDGVYQTRHWYLVLRAEKRTTKTKPPQ